jgi:fatty-acyl-CoA synthase
MNPARDEIRVPERELRARHRELEALVRLAQPLGLRGVELARLARPRPHRLSLHEPELYFRRMTSRHDRYWPTRLPRSLPRAERTLASLLEDSARRLPDKPLAVFFGATLSYREAWEQAGRLAGYLRDACGVKPGDRVLLDLQNSPQFVVGCFAVLRAGAVVVPLSPMNVAEELAHYADDAQARVAVVGQETWPQCAGLVGRTSLERAIVAAYADYADPDCDLPRPAAVAAARERIEGNGVALWSDALAVGRAPMAQAARPAELCVMPYTSGSTGSPKGCMHTHQTALHNVLGAVLWEGVREDSVALATAPFFHVTGFIHSLMAAVACGATIVIQPRWDPHLAARLIERYRCTHWANVPTMVVDLLSHARALEHDVSSLECVFGGGAAMPEAIAQRLFDRCGIRYMEGYGLTETISQTHMNPAERTKKQCLGIPTFDTEALVVDPGGARVLDPGERGEIVVRGPQLLTGYWRNEAAYRESWIEVDGRAFFRTGDLGHVDEDGYFFISDRLKRMINAAGYKVWPAEVEAAMYGHPAIRECCIIASPDERRGETVKAVVVLRAEARGRIGADEILAWAHDRMAAYKAPRKIEFVDALPRSGSGKIQWRSLQEKEFA